MAEYDVLSGPPVLAIDLYAVVHRDRGHSVGLLCAGQESWMGSPTWLLQRTSPVKACSGDQTPNVAARRGSVTKRSRCFHPRDSLSRRHGWTASRDRTPDIRVRSPSAHFEDQAKRSEEHTSELQSLRRISYA